ncbi:unnamed protein product [Closterium sp. NIES-54]
MHRPSHGGFSDPCAMPCPPVPEAVRYAAHQLNQWPSDAWPRVTPISLWTGSPDVAADYYVWGSLAHVLAPGANKWSPRTRACVETCVSSLGACVVSILSASEGPCVGAAATTSLAPAFIAGSGATSQTAQLSFILDSRLSSYFFRDCTDLMPPRTPVNVALAYPSAGPVVAHSTTTLLYLAAPSRFLTGYYTPSFSRTWSSRVACPASPLTCAAVHSLHRGSVARCPSLLLLLIVMDDYSRYSTVFPLRRKADVPTVLEPWLLATGGAQGLCGLRLNSDRGGPIVSRGAGGVAAEGGGTGAAGPGGADSGGTAGVRVETFLVEDTAVSTRRPCPASPPGFPSVPRFPPRLALRPVVAEPRGVPMRGIGDTGGVVAGGSGSRGAGAGVIGTATPTPRTIRFLTPEGSRPQQQVQLQPQQERAEEEPQEQQQGQVLSQQTPEELEQQQLRDLPNPPPARLVCGPLPSPPVPPDQSLSSSQWTRGSPHSRAVSPESRRSCYYADGPFHLILRSRVPPPHVLPQPPELSLKMFQDPLSNYLRASRPAVSHVLSALVTHSSALPLSVSALVTIVTGFASSHRLDYAAHLVSGPARSPSSRGAPIFSLEVLEDKQFELGFLEAVVPHLFTMLLAPEGYRDALDIPIPCTHAEAVSGP